MAIQESEALFAGSDDSAQARSAKGLYKPSEAKVLGRALRYIAIGVDLNLGEKFDFTMLLVERTVLGKAGGLSIADSVEGFFSKVKERASSFEPKKSACSNHIGAE